MSDEGEYSTIVFWHPNKEAAKALTIELLDRFPFAGGRETTCITAMALGDAMSVSDAVRMALECRALGHDERRELALHMCECPSWDACMKLAEEWELRAEHGAFIDAREPSNA